MSNSGKKIKAIYDLRRAAEEKAVAEVAVDSTPTAKHRDEFLDATLELEAKTVEAIEACHECGSEHVKGAPCSERPAREKAY